MIQHANSRFQVRTKQWFNGRVIVAVLLGTLAISSYRAYAVRVAASKRNTAVAAISRSIPDHVPVEDWYVYEGSNPVAVIAGRSRTTSLSNGDSSLVLLFGTVQASDAADFER